MLACSLPKASRPAQPVVSVGERCRRSGGRIEQIEPQASREGADGQTGGERGAARRAPSRRSRSRPRFHRTSGPGRKASVAGFLAMAVVSSALVTPLPGSGTGSDADGGAARAGSSASRTRRARGRSRRAHGGGRDGSWSAAQRRLRTGSMPRSRAMSSISGATLLELGDVFDGEEAGAARPSAARGGSAARGPPSARRGCARTARRGDRRSSSRPRRRSTSSTATPAPRRSTRKVLVLKTGNVRRIEADRQPELLGDEGPPVPPHRAAAAVAADLVDELHRERRAAARGGSRARPGRPWRRGCRCWRSTPSCRRGRRSARRGRSAGARRAGRRGRWSRRWGGLARRGRGHPPASRRSETNCSKVVRYRRRSGSPERARGSGPRSPRWSSSTAAAACRRCAETCAFSPRRRSRNERPGSASTSALTTPPMRVAMPPARTQSATSPRASASCPRARCSAWAAVPEAGASAMSPA